MVIHVNGLQTVVPLKVRSNNGCKCTTEPSDDVTTLQALLCEVLVTSILIFLCMGVWDRRNSRNTDSTPIKFGLLVAAVSMAEVSSIDLPSPSSPLPYLRITLNTTLSYNTYSTTEPAKYYPSYHKQSVHLTVSQL